MQLSNIHLPLTHPESHLAAIIHFESRPFSYIHFFHCMSGIKEEKSVWEVYHIEEEKKLCLYNWRYGYILFLSKRKMKVILLKIIEADCFT